MTDLLAYAAAAAGIVLLAVLMFYTVEALVCLLIDRGES